MEAVWRMCVRQEVLGMEEGDETKPSLKVSDSLQLAQNS